MSQAVTGETGRVTPSPKAKAAISEGKKAERRLGLLLCAPAVLVMAAVAGWPIIYSVWLSLQRYDLKFPDRREFVGLDNYVTVLTNGYWWNAMWITVVITVVSVLIELALGMALALIMHRTLVGRGIVRTSTLIPYGIVTVVAAFSWRYAWTPGTGYLAETIAGGEPVLTQKVPAVLVVILAEIWKTTPFMALLLMAGLALVPDDLLKAAAMDGANAWQRFTKVMLPVMKPAILVALLFRTLDAFRIFDNLFVLTGGSQGTTSVSMVTYNNLIKGLNLGIGSTMSVLIFLTVALIALVFIKLFGTSAPGSDNSGRR
ncbi:carbohydrate ABC transporter permease [Saccharothrix australiensis]|uniref:Carbohydrate ABC transporter membrane protein 1 (CUT1 family) n=1 Tax=Saccharothrix australiensis TaxID=2072 RepID=A0A495VVZ9_9PSEU|nr:sugar ABC transporter permease [Saccharothrix australiensis]RKT52663.1 carbohydrate ABC transporter membrane protein 1 (CUT1 family) [Saccharothrix australiensis]